MASLARGSTSSSGTAALAGFCSYVTKAASNPKGKLTRQQIIRNLQTSAAKDAHTNTTASEAAQASTSTTPFLNTDAKDPAEPSSYAALSDEEFTILERKRRMALMESLEPIGSSQTRHNTFQPHHTLSRSKTPSSVTLSHLLASTAHLGHSTSISSPYAFPYIYGKRHGINIIDVRETLVALRRASALLRSTMEKDGIVLFVGTKDMDKILIKNVDEKLGRNGYFTTKWMPGTITNSSKLFSASATLLSRETAASGSNRAINSTHLNPSLIVLLSPLSTPHALREANSSNIPTIALCDTNVDPRHFTYPIPSNDDSLRVIELITGVLAEAGKEGLKRKDARLQLLQSQRNDRGLALQREYANQKRVEDRYKRKQR